MHTLCCHKLKVNIFLLFLILVWGSVRADKKVHVKGLDYIIKDDLTAIVTYNDSLYIQHPSIIEIPENIKVNKQIYKVTSIGIEAFYCCWNLTEVKLPNSIESIGAKAFYGCQALNKINFPQSLKSIDFGAFWFCRSLEEIILPDALEYIGQGAFYGCLSNSFIEVPIGIAYRNSDFPHNNLNVRHISWETLNNKILSWEEFYNNHRRLELTYKNAEEIEKKVNSEIEDWQKKDEFETTEQWKNRVNEVTRQAKIKEISEEIISQYNEEVARIKEEERQLSLEYEVYKQDIVNAYYKSRIEVANENFSSEDFQLKPYDADNGTFLINSAKYGDILLPVMLEEGRSFKDNWEKIKSSVRPEFVPNGEDVILTKLIFTNNGKEYVYDSHTEARYAITDVKYNFKPVELADISLDDLKTDLPELKNLNSVSQVVAKSNTESITPKKVSPQINSLVASDRSNVDYEIPTGFSAVNPSTFAVIIANEDYSSNVNVPFAINDGEIMAKYLSTTVGLPQNHIKLFSNATYGKMAEAIDYIEKLSEAYGDKLNLIFYYAGHGLPDEKSKSALLLPVDGNPNIPSTCYKLDNIVKKLGNIPSDNIVMILDACFSGSVRGEGMLLSARGVKLHSNELQPKGNIIILSAARGDETAFPYDKEGHGLFTFYLLKKLQENKGSVTLGELADYVIENVKQTSVVNTGKIQTPNVIVSPKIKSTWRSIPLSFQKQ